MSELGRVIRKALDQVRSNQTQLALQSGYTQKHISQLISGKATLTVPAALKLEAVLYVTAEDLMAAYVADERERRKSHRLREGSSAYASIAAAYLDALSRAWVGNEYPISGDASLLRSDR